MPVYYLQRALGSASASASTLSHPVTPLESTASSPSTGLCSSKDVCYESMDTHTCADAVEEYSTITTSPSSSSEHSVVSSLSLVSSRLPLSPAPVSQQCPRPQNPHPFLFQDLLCDDRVALPAEQASTASQITPHVQGLKQQLLGFHTPAHSICEPFAVAQSLR